MLCAFVICLKEIGNLEKDKYTVADLIERLKELPQDTVISGYIFQTDEGEYYNTFKMGEIVKK